METPCKTETPACHAPSSPRPAPWSRPAAQAQSSPFYLRASETLSYDSNLFRVPDKSVLNNAGIHARDGISSTELTVGIDQPYGRQRWLASAGISANVFKNNDQLNNTGYDLLLGLDWQALSRWAGDVRITSTQQLANFENYGAQFIVDTSKNLEQVNGISARARYGLVSLWSLEGTFAHRDVNFSDDLFREPRIPPGPGRLRRRLSAERPADARARRPLHRRAISARREHGSDKYKRDDIDLTANWKVERTVSLRCPHLGHAREPQPAGRARLPRRDGQPRLLNYRPTGKTTLDLRLSRDTGTRGNGAPPRLDPSATAAFLTDARLSDRLDAGVRWEATSKITVLGQASYSHDRYDEQFITGGGAIVTGDSGNTRNFKIGATYQVTRAWLLGCEAGRRSRSTPVFIGGVGYSYDADVASLHGPVDAAVSAGGDATPPSLLRSLHSRRPCAAATRCARG